MIPCRVAAVDEPIARAPLRDRVQRPADGILPAESVGPLSLAEVDRRVRIRRVKEEGAPALAYLQRSGLVSGRLLTVWEARPVDGVVTVEDEAGSLRSLGPRLVGSILVERPQGGDADRASRPEGHEPGGR